MIFETRLASFSLLFVLSLTFFSPSLFGDSLDISPGLWSLEIQTTVNGKKMDLTGMMGAMMDAMPPEQKKMMEEQMKKAGASFQKKSTQICVTKEDLSRPADLMDNKSDCKTTIKTQSAKKIAGNITCPPEKKPAQFSVEALSKTKYHMEIKGFGHEGMTMDMTQNGTFISSDCGKLKK